MSSVRRRFLISQSILLGNVLIIHTYMPLGRSVSANMRELMKDNMKKGKARGAGGKMRSHKQMVAIALSAAGKSKKKKAVPGMGIMRKATGGRY